VGCAVRGGVRRSTRALLPYVSVARYRLNEGVAICHAAARRERAVVVLQS
jgi:hypothetical protein